MRSICLLLGATAIMNMSSGNARPFDVSRHLDGVTMQTQSGWVRVQFWAPGIVRVVHSPTPTYPDRPSLMVLPESKTTVAWQYEQTHQGAVLRSPELVVEIDKAGNVRFGRPDGPVLLQETQTVLEPAVVSGENTYHVQQVFHVPDGDALYGLGQHQDGVMNYRGHDVTLVQENRIVAVPFLSSSGGWGILWENYSRTRFHDGQDGTWLWSEVGDGVDYYFVAGENLDAVIAGYRRLTGDAPLFGRWAYGYWQSKERYRSQHEIISVAQEYRRRHVPLDNIVQDWQYWGKHGWNAMEFDHRFFPNPKAMLDSLHALHTHVMISVWPVFDSTTAVWKDFKQHGFLCRKPDGTYTRLYDAYNPAARDLYWDWLNRKLFSIGIDAWWLDATEPEFPGATLDEIAETAKALGRHYLGTWARYLNAYSLMTCKGVYEHQRATTDRKRVFILTRSAYGGQQRYAAATWSGDITASWEVLRKQISAGLNFCLSGLPYWSMDIGAFVPNNPLGCRDEAYRELYVRWFQFGAFCPIFRSHGTGTPREVWQFGDKGEWAYEALVKMDRLRYRLLPTIYSLAWRVTHRHYTLMRALAFDFPHDPRALNEDREFLFGPSLLVAPVTEKMYFDHTYTGQLISSKNLFTADGRPGGLTARFYHGTNFDTLVAQQVVPKVDFDWKQAGRPDGVRSTFFSVRFQGEVLTEEPGDYIFAVTSNDGVRLWVGDTLVIDNWTGHGVTIDFGRVHLEAHKRYPIRLDYFQLGGNAITRLAWIRPSEVARLRPQQVPPPKPWPVYLPAGAEWVDFWSGQRHRGGQTVEVPAPIDRVPLFVRTGSILAFGPVVQYWNEKPADPIELRVYPGADAELVLYEDEGDGYAYERGEYATIPIHWDDAKCTLTLGPRQGHFPGMLETRTFRVVLVRPGHGVGVESEAQPDRVVNYRGEETKIKL